MTQSQKKRFIKSLMLLVILCCASCAREVCDCPAPILPPFPLAGSQVADELEAVGDLPHTFEWIARLYKLKQVLSIK